MASFNKVILMGNLTRDPEIRQTPSGAKVAELRLAVSETWRDKSGQSKEVTCFVDVVVWEKLAELCQQYLAKGRPVLVEGRLQMDEWKNQQGETRSKLRVRADAVKFVGPAPKQGEPHDSLPGGAHASPAAPAPALAAEEPAHDLSSDEEHLPF
ncbi:MAG: single-stranded DNA-binding protein [Kiritimatiellae bacterium]|nr:single-stranded DNA-binding protein [Kiritimatiellia bacterium]